MTDIMNIVREELYSRIVRKIIYNGPKTIVLWSDGTKTIVSCAEIDDYDRYAGFCAALAKKALGSSSAIRKLVDNKAVEY